LWSQVRAVVQTRIQNGDYPIGSLLPREIDLAADLAVSRNTVREAIRRLADDGFVLRRKRVGTKVVADAPALRLDLNPQASLRSLSEHSEMVILKRELASLPADAHALWQGSPPDGWLRIEYIRAITTEGSPLSWTEIYLSPDLHDLGEMVGIRRTQFFRLIEELGNERMLRTKTQLVPCVIGSRVGTLLNMEADELALKVMHAMLNEEGACRELVISVYPSRHYRFETSFRLHET
jgi:DNA-binding GntR family transcriptional regulator